MIYQKRIANEKKGNTAFEDFHSGNSNAQTIQEEGIDLYGTYNENDLLIHQVEENYNEKVVKIPQIEGLKNLAVQNKINEEIRHQLYECLKKFSNYEGINLNVGANFANVLSIQCTIYEKDWSSSENIVFNYELVTGKKLNFEDLLKKDVDVTKIVRKGFYDFLVRNTYYDEDFYESNEDYSIRLAYPDENELYKAVKGFMKEEEKFFTFTPKGISFTYGKYYGYMDFMDIADEVVIYQKYLTKDSLFTRNDIGRKDVFTCVLTNYDLFQEINYGFLEKNYWYDITIRNDYFADDDIDEEKLSKFKAFQETIYKKAYDIVDDYQKIAKENPDKFYIVFGKPYVSITTLAEYKEGEWKYIYTDLASSNMDFMIYEMPMQVYEEVYKDKLIQAYRYAYFVMAGGVNIEHDEEDNVEVTELKEEKLYNFITREELTELTDVFQEDSQYLEVLKEKVKEILNNLGKYSETEIESFLENVQFELKGECIQANVPGLEDFKIAVYLYELDKNLFKGL